MKLKSLFKYFYLLGAPLTISILLLFSSSNFYSCSEQEADSCSFYILHGYTDKVSYNPGDKVKVYLQSNSIVVSCNLDVHDVLGNLVFSIPIRLFPQHVKENTSVLGCGFDVTMEFDIPSSLQSGVYQIENQVPFIVKSQEPVDVLILYPSNTSTAYNAFGGHSLYSLQGRPSEVSFLRPIPLQPNSIYCLKWFSSQEDLKIGYVADIDLEHYENLSSAKVLAIVGHSEYWTRNARMNFDRYVNEGGHALILSGNTMWWQVRYSDTSDRLICYKGLHDPISDPLLKTESWIVHSLEYPISSSIGADFARGGYGTISNSGFRGYKIVSPNSPLLAGLQLKRGDIIHLPSVESDGAPVKFFEKDGTPVLDKEALAVEQLELIGYDIGQMENVKTTPTFIVFRKNQTTGIVVNMSTTDWCSINGMGGKSEYELKTITRNAINLLLSGENIFSE